MKISTQVINSELTLVGDIRAGKVVELSKHQDYFMGKTKSFWRVDAGGRTISSLHKTKAEAMKSAKNYINKNWK